MGEHIRIGNRLFGLDHVTSIEPAEEKGTLVVDIHIVPGRSVRLTGDDAKAANFFVSSFPRLPVDQAAQDIVDREQEAAQDTGMRHNQSVVGRMNDTRY